MCDEPFELMPHQLFVKNFLSFQTPYNSLLLYHGLGSGKTCSSIGISEEMRQYMKQVGIKQRIIVIAAPNVQANFKLQLFDERRLKEVDGLWNIESCAGNTLIQEVNPTNLKGIPREKIISQVKSIINQYYVFMGYVELSNYIRKKTAVLNEGFSEEDQRKMEVQNMRKFFNNRLIIIDEVHNIRLSEDNKDDKTGKLLMKLAKYCNNMRFLLLSATPMYNDPREVIWLLNLMNKNDGRSTIEMKQVFNSNGDMVINADGEEVGKELLMRKATGYVSFLRGDNPYAFPYRIFPQEFAKKQSIKGIDYPTKGITGNRIVQRMEHLDLFCQQVDGYQAAVYEKVIGELKRTTGEKKMPNPDNMERFGYTVLQKPLEALNMVFPVEEGELDDTSIGDLVGQGGLSRMMTFKNRKNYEYRDGVEEKFGRIFAESEIPKYSAKISAICDAVLSSEGICLVYSQYLDGGLIPIALALE